MSSRCRRLWVSALLLPACSGADAPGTPVEVTVARPDREAQYEEVLRIGASSGDSMAEFGAVADVAIGPQGEIYVLDLLNHAVRAFDPAGGFVRSLGRMGGAPGEFLTPLSIAIAGDSILVFDSRQSKVVAYSTSGQFISSRPLEPLPFSGWTREYKRLKTGSWLALEQRVPLKAGPFTPGQVVRAQANFHKADMAAGDWAVIVELTGGEAIVAEERGLVEHPYPAAPLWDVDPTGGFWYADSREALLHHFNEDGSLGSAVGFRDLRSPALTSVVSDTIVRAAEATGAKLPATIPPLLKLVSSDAGDVWVQLWNSEWWILGRNGEAGRRVQLPKTLVPHVVRGDTAWGVVEDTLGVEYVVRVVIR